MTHPQRFALLISHALVGALGFALGVYFLPILVAPPAPTADAVAAQARTAAFTGEFRRDLPGSDPFHWGEGTVTVGPDSIAFLGTLAPGPDYKVYLSPAFVDTAEAFLALKPQMALIGDVRTFDNFLVAVPGTVDPGEFTTVVVWCETFSKFITAAEYR